jgi:chorismate dehydratase
MSDDLMIDEYTPTNVPALRVGISLASFNNVAPYRLVPPACDIAFVSGDPSQLTSLMARGELDACLLPTGAMPALDGAFTPLGPYGIGCNGHVLSVRLFSRIPVQRLLDTGRSIYVTPRSTTSRLLISELFLMDYGLRPRISSDPAQCDARVIIGDEAMDLSREEWRWPVSRDLGEWWFEQTSLPFIFAQWVTRRTLNAVSVTALQQWIEQNLAAAATEDGRARMAALAVESGWSPAMGRLYFERINYRFTPQHFAGLALFHSRSRLFDEAARGIANAI